MFHDEVLNSRKNAKGTMYSRLFMIVDSKCSFLSIFTIVSTSITFFITIYLFPPININCYTTNWVNLYILKCPSCKYSWVENSICCKICLKNFTSAKICLEEGIYASLRKNVHTSVVRNVIILFSPFRILMILTSKTCPMLRC